MWYLILHFATSFSPLCSSLFVLRSKSLGSSFQSEASFYLITSCFKFFSNVFLRYHELILHFLTLAFLYAFVAFPAGNFSRRNPIEPPHSNPIVSPECSSTRYLRIHKIHVLLCHMFIWMFMCKTFRIFECDRIVCWSYNPLIFD